MSVIKVCVTPDEVVFSQVKNQSDTKSKQTHVDVEGTRYYLDHTTPSGHDVYQLYDFDAHTVSLNGRLVGGACVVLNTNTIKIPALWEAWVGGHPQLPGKDTFLHTSEISIHASSGAVSKPNARAKSSAGLGGGSTKSKKIGGGGGGEDSCEDEMDEELLDEEENEIDGGDEFDDECGGDEDDDEEEDGGDEDPDEDDEDEKEGGRGIDIE